MARPRKHDGVVYRRRDTRFWWIRYWDGAGHRREESTGTSDWKEAQQRLRARLQARDENVLDFVRKGERTTVRDWTAHFLEVYSVPPLRSEKTCESHQRAIKHLNAAFGDRKLTDLTADGIERFLRTR